MKKYEKYDKNNNSITHSIRPKPRADHHPKLSHGSSPHLAPGIRKWAQPHRLAVINCSLSLLESNEYFMTCSLQRTKLQNIINNHRCSLTTCDVFVGQLQVRSIRTQLSHRRCLLADVRTYVYTRPTRSPRQQVLHIFLLFCSHSMRGVIGLSNYRRCEVYRCAVVLGRTTMTGRTTEFSHYCGAITSVATLRKWIYGYYSGPHRVSLTQSLLEDCAICSSRDDISRNDICCSNCIVSRRWKIAIYWAWFEEQSIGIQYEGIYAVCLLIVL